MTKEAQCVLGNGNCPPDCPLNKQSSSITDKLEDQFDPFESRLSVVFADAFKQDVSIVDVANVMSLCVKEGHNK